MKNSRRSAAFIVSKWQATGGFPSEMLPESGPDRAFVQDLVYTVVRRFRPLRKILGMLLEKWPKGELESLLYVGAAQILYMDDVPDFAAVNDTVEAAKECSNPNVAKVVNGVLRNLVRRRGEFLAMLASAPAEERESFPGALFRRWVRRYGVENAERLAIWHNTPADTFLAYPDRFEKLERGRKVSDVEGFAEGAFIVQDPATAMAVELLDPQPGEKILDLCAAPGGKTIQIAWRGAEVTACEVKSSRSRRLAENLLRVGLADKVEVIASPDGMAPGSMAKILVDAPCSNTGVFRRRPDARWNWSEEKLSALVELQSEILDRAAEICAPGGVVVYSTCSNEPEENLGVVEAFLSRHGEFSLVSSRESIPHETGHDGAFAALLSRARSDVQSAGKMI
jgi:16S rRNA (cytosine967-C5)-methyltransferase